MTIRRAILRRVQRYKGEDGLEEDERLMEWLVDLPQRKTHIRVFEQFAEYL